MSTDVVDGDMPSDCLAVHFSPISSPPIINMTTGCRTTYTRGKNVEIALTSLRYNMYSNHIHHFIMLYFDYIPPSIVYFKVNLK